MPLSKIQTGNLGRRNLLINGDFQIFQRATSATNPGGGYDTADRWRSSQNSSGLGNYNAEQSTDTPNGFGFSYKLTKSGSTSISSGMSAYIEQYIEGQNVQHLNYGSSSAKKLTASFHVKSSVTGTYGCFLGDGTTNGKKNVQTFTISSANTWEKKVLTFNGDTATALDNDNSAELVFGIVLAAGSNYQTSTTNSWLSAANPSALSTSSQTQWVQTDGATFFMTGIQLEVGDAPTEFEHISRHEMLLLCERYYQVYIAAGQEWIYHESNYRTHKWWQSPIKVPMRANPTTSDDGGFTGAAHGATVSGITQQGISGDRVSWRVTYTADNGNANNVYHTDNFDQNKIKMDSELG